VGYLNLPDGIPDFTQAIISLWFRIPQSALDQVNADYNAWSAANLFPANPPPMVGVIPLVTMGKEGEAQTPYQGTPSQVVASVTHTWGVANCGVDNSVTIEAVDTVNNIAQGTYVYNPSAYLQPVTEPPDMWTVYDTEPTGLGDPTFPTFIGVNTGGQLWVNFETGQKATVEGFQYELRSMTQGYEYGYGPPCVVSVYFGGTGGTPDDPCAAFFTGTRVEQWHYPGLGLVSEQIGPAWTVSDNTHWVDFPNCPTVVVDPVFNYVDISSTVLNATGSIYSLGINVTPNQWHHLLVSVDLATVQTHGTILGEPFGPNWTYVDAASHLYMAFDDKNLTGYDLDSNWPGNPDDLNAVITDDAFTLLGQDQAQLLRLRTPGGAYYDTGVLPKYTLTDPSVPAKDQPMGFPAQPKYVDNIYRVEMAEFQMWTGQILDPASEANRRLFVDADGKPVDPRVTAHALGEPLILLHGSNKWINGENRGSLSDEGQASPTGDFIPHKTIVAYKPDPSLHGDQGPPSQPQSAKAKTRGRDAVRLERRDDGRPVVRVAGNVTVRPRG
jgi:hypothetical protein